MSELTNPAPEALLVVGDVFFSAKLRDTLKHLGMGAKSARTDAEVAGVLGAMQPRLVIVDLTIKTLSAAALIARMKGEDATRSVPVIAFAGHVFTEALGAAAEAGADRVVTNGQIAGNLPGIVADLGLLTDHS
jgi:two-component system cell cycle response regulator DivK